MFRQSIFRIYENLPNEKKKKLKFKNCFTIWTQLHHTSYVFVNIFSVVKIQQFVIMLTAICSFRPDV